MTAPYTVVMDEKAASRIELRGANRALISCRTHEVIDSGAAETGKTWAACVKMHLTLLKYPGCQGAMVRKNYNSITGSCGKTFERIIKGANVQTVGGNFPTRYVYPNASVLWVGGMDNPDKVLSSERDFIYVNQAEELSVSDWETLLTRCTGRGAVIKFPQLMGDCNPAGSKHWIRQRAASGKLTLLKATHADNPTLFTTDGKITPQGERSLAALNNLTGVRKKRLLEGIWATAEGAVYDMFDPSVHVKARPASEMRRWFIAVDIGFTNPAVSLLVGEDGDGRWHCFREFYKTGVLPEDHAQQIRGWWNERATEVCVVDAAAAGFIATLQGMGVNAIPGKGTVLGKGGSGGIQAIQNRLKVQGDNLPRLTIDPGCIEFINEMESYSWQEGKDVPKKEFDHACDAIRYLADQMGEPTGAWDASAIAAASARLPADPTDIVENDGLEFTDLTTDL